MVDFFPPGELNNFNFSNILRSYFSHSLSCIFTSSASYKVYKERPINFLVLFQSEAETFHTVLINAGQISKPAGGDGVKAVTAKPIVISDIDLYH